MAYPQNSGQVALPNDGQVTDLANPEPNQIAQQISAQRTSATPVAPPQSPAPQNPDSLSGRDHLMGRMVGKLMSGLQGEHTEYSIDPNTGTTVPTTVRDKPGSVFKSILAYGLLGGQGIGPKEGEQNFSQGLLAGLGSGTRTSMEQKEKLDAQRRANAQQQYANQLKANEEQRQNKELAMKQQLNSAAIANYTAQTTMEKFNLMKAYQENQHGAVQQMVAKDAPMLQTFEAAGMKPIKEGLSPDEFHKLLADDANDINAHKVIPVITGYTAKVNPDQSVTWEPVGALYPPGTKYTTNTLSQLKDAGYKDSDPLYRDISQKVKNGTSVDPREFLTTYREIGQHFDYAKNRSEIAKNDAERIHALSEAGEAGVRAKMANLQLDQAKSAQQGKELFNFLGTTDGFTRPGTKEKVTIPATSDGGYDFSQLTDKEKVSLRDYMDVRQEMAQQNLDKLVTASKANPDDKSINGMIQQESSTLSTLNNMANSLNGTRKVPRIQATQGTLDRLAQTHADKLTGNAQDLFTGLLQKGLSEEQAQKALIAAPLDPAEKIAVSNELTSYFNEATPIIKQQLDERNNANQVVTNAQRQAWLRQHPQAFQPSTNVPVL